LLKSLTSNFLQEARSGFPMPACDSKKLFSDRNSPLILKIVPIAGYECSPDKIDQWERKKARTKIWSGFWNNLWNWSMF